MIKNNHKEYKAMQVYNQINALQENNRNGRYNDRIEELKKELEELLNTIEVRGRQQR